MKQREKLIVGASRRCWCSFSGFVQGRHVLDPVEFHAALCSSARILFCNASWKWIRFPAVTTYHQRCHQNQSFCGLQGFPRVGESGREG